MRKLILSTNASLDGYIEGKNGDMSWMQPDDDDTWDDLFGMLKNNVDLFLLGRGMWAEYRNYCKKHWPGRRSSRLTRLLMQSWQRRHRTLFFPKRSKSPAGKIPP